jgi:putative signal transducing protein
MFCPVCESEYQPGITRCPDDNVELVEQLTPHTIHDDSEARFVLLHNFGSPTEAEMVDDILKQNNIRSLVRGRADAFSAALSSTALGAAVLVDERDYDRAEELYHSIFAEDTTPLTGAEVEEDEYQE